MKLGILLAALLATVAQASQSGPALEKLKLLYVGDSGTPRAEEFAGFLRQKVAQLELASRDKFSLSLAEPFDVVLLDWPQSQSAREDRKQGRSPLGDRATWNKPTVLLASAGLNLAIVWKVRGGSG